ncbi:MAG: T9SS type A sorting domain-containing protein [Bacteroidota bacterium]
MKIFNLIGFMFLFPYLTLAQDYVPFPTDSAIWAEDWAIADAGTVFNEGITIYFILGDTIYEGIEYSNLWVTQCGNFEEEWCIDLQGFIREESKRIYYRGEPYGFESEVVIYDFNYYINNGNVVYDGPDSLDFWNVTNIGTKTLNSGEERGFQFQSWRGEVVYGIGFLYGRGLLGNYSGLDQGAWLNCHSTIEGHLYGDIGPMGTVSCFDPGVIGLDEQNFERIDIFPNPSRGIFRLQLRKEVPQIEVKILDVNGKEVFYYQSLSERQLNIDFEANPGMYILQVFSEGELLGANKILRY